MDPWAFHGHKRHLAHFEQLLAAWGRKLEPRGRRPLFTAPLRQKQTAFDTHARARLTEEHSFRLD